MSSSLTKRCYKTSFTKTFRFPGLELSITLPILSWELQTESTTTGEHSKANNQRLTPTIHTLKQSHTHPHTTGPLFAPLHSRILLTTMISEIPTGSAHSPLLRSGRGRAGHELGTFREFTQSLLILLPFQTNHFPIPTLRTLPKHPLKKAFIESSPEFSK